MNLFPANATKKIFGFGSKSVMSRGEFLQKICGSYNIDKKMGKQIEKELEASKLIKRINKRANVRITEVL